MTVLASPTFVVLLQNQVEISFNVVAERGVRTQI
jgi:hypothetical protein